MASLVQVKGRWDGPSQANLKELVKFPKVMEKVATKVVHDAAVDFKVRVVDSIESQTGNWAPLSPVWTKKKVYLNLDPRILVATGEYLRSFQVELGPLRGSVLSHQVLGRWIEYGTFGVPNTKMEKLPGRMPARPHLIPALDQVTTRLPGRVRKEVRDAFSGR